MKKSALLCATVLTALAIPATGSSAPAPDLQAPPVDPYTEFVEPGASSPAPADRAQAPDASEPSLLRKGGGKQLLTGFGDFLYTAGDDSVRRKAMDQTVGVNGSVVRLYVDWRRIAPVDPTNAFNASDPADPQYSWEYLDNAVKDAAERGLSPILLATSAPDWAEGPNRDPEAANGTWKPNPKDVGAFGAALAKRYAGGFQDLPKVRDYMLWNEPNLPTNLMPQWNGKKPVAPDHYRDMLNAFYDAVHGVSGSNRVITGGTAPYGFPNGEYSMRPLIFWRGVMCVKDGKKPKAGNCKTKPKFDVLAHHPINTSGGPTRSAIDPDDVSTPDLHNLVDVLRAAEKGNNIGTKGKHPVWATELWWESNPPDRFKTNPSLAMQAQYYAQAMYVLWKQGASMVLLYQVRDEPHYGEPGRFTGSSYETGIYFVDNKPKPAVQAVRFPLVADRVSGSKAVIWGIAPESGKVVVTQSGSGPKKVATFNGKAGQIFTKQVKLSGKHKLQAKVGKTKSLKYPLK